ncbi:hypothetical protein M441DRAFT_207145 [Trichoderma asperellum CBS 433.97]|uniref:Uncharacterized protein n=1 Tax=Trichoderma asperellum (strain ATCC 204424 / CBS 433.97 / NBRC 101777) TaxID=1042311 RepID=A0A2T3ZMH0_TRIA4|nr:hypothetical protein M441DRAFT_207145 [Trichoderma asperellum CBS 433.97]PTB45982.1 hypothetical protein M441DRAFT_207145 [Trichoderma asperellum CBS 433.97]WVH32746.1 putative PepSY TM-like protein [Trichoderma asperellum]
MKIFWGTTEMLRLDHFAWWRDESVCLSASRAPCSVDLGRDGEQRKSTLYELCGERNGPMSVETRFLIERVVHREHGSWCGGAVVCTFQVIASHLATGRCTGDNWTLFLQLFSFACLLFFKMHNWVLTHMPTAGSIAPTRGKYASWKTEREGEIPLSYSAALRECVIVLLSLTTSPMLFSPLERKCLKLDSLVEAMLSLAKGGFVSILSGTLDAANWLASAVGL